MRRELGKKREELGGKKRSRDHVFGPVHGHEAIEQFLVGILVAVNSVRVAPYVNVAPVCDGSEEGRLACSVFPDEEGHRRGEFQALGLLKDPVVEGIMVQRRIFFRKKHYSLEMHGQFP